MISEVGLEAEDSPRRVESKPTATIKAVRDATILAYSGYTLSSSNDKCRSLV